MRCLGSRACFTFEHFVLRSMGSRVGLKFKKLRDALCGLTCLSLSLSFYVMHCVAGLTCMF